MIPFLRTLVIFIPFLSFAQRLQFIDQETQLSIPFVRINDTITNRVLLTDLDGILIPKKSDSLGNSVKIQCPGYDPLVYTNWPPERDTTFVLKPLSNLLNTVDITSKKAVYKQTKLGITNEAKTQFLTNELTGSTGDIKAFWVPNQKNRKGKLDAINVYITSSGYPDAPFRVRIYSCDPFEIAPGKELTTQNLIASGTTGNEWVSLDVSAMKIPLNKNGFFVGIEWLPETKDKAFSDTLYFEFSNGTVKHLNQGNGVVLGTVDEKYATCKYKNWTKTPTGWLQYTVNESCFYEPDTLSSGHIYTPTPYTYYLKVPCINASVTYLKEKEKNDFKDAKKRKLKKIEKVDYLPIFYPQNSVDALFYSLIKAFEQDDFIYVLTYLCAYQDDEFKSIYAEIKEKTPEGIVKPDEKVKVITYLQNIRANIDETNIVDLGDGSYTLTVDNDTYYLTYKNGVWKINPYTYRVVPVN